MHVFFDLRYACFLCHCQGIEAMAVDVSRKPVERETELEADEADREEMYENVEMYINYVTLLNEENDLSKKYARFL